jgi:hypothetical protein
VPAALGVVPGTTGQIDPASAWPIAGQTGVASGSGTSQHGVTPLMGSGGMIGDAVNRVWAWLSTPFTTSMAPIDIFLLVGVVLIALLMWNMILYHIRIAAESI